MFFIGSTLAGITFFILLYTVANVSLLSHKNVTDSRAVFGGTQAGKNAYPYFVKLRTSRGSCGGTLIHHSYILTSAHCVNFITESSNGGHIFVLFGVNNYNSSFEGHHAAVIHHTKEKPTIFIHEKYEDKPINQYDTNDIALINTGLFLYTIPVPDLPQSTFTLLQQTFSMIGVGTKSITSGTSSQTLDEASLKVTSVDPTTHMFKAESITNKNQSGCPGDSGGPAIATINGIPTIIGVIAGGYCNLHKSTTFVSVPAYRSWITGIIGSNPPYINTISANTIYPTQHPLSPVCATRVKNECGLYSGMCVWNTKYAICETVN